MLAMLAAVLIAAAPQYDTVFLADGGRILGTVIEEGPQGIAVQLPDGTTRRLASRDVVRVEYQDGSISTPNRPPPPPPTYAPPPATSPPPAASPPPAYPPPPAYGPPPPYAPPPPTYRPVPPREPPARYADPRGGMPPILPVYGAFGLGGAFMSGQVEEGISVDDVFGSQLDVWLEGGLRLTPNVALGLYLDVGVGDPAREIRDSAACDGSLATCTATTARFGVLVRHTFHPRAHSTPWIAAGTGFDFGSVTVDYDDGGSDEELFSYRGWEVLRLMAGVDLRANPVIGFGLYGGVAFGSYSSYEDAAGEDHLDDRRFHTTVQAGVRFTLFP